MNRLTCLYSELDEETRAYLQEVRTRRGNRTPGVYVGGSNPWPVVAFIFGPIVTLLALSQSFLSTKDAWAVAMLQTAGVMTGGWMVLYAFRRWFASPKKFAGYFTYFDPKHVYQAAGDTVTVTDISDFNSVDVSHAFSNGTYNGSRVLFDLAGRQCAIPVKGEARADLVEDYYRSLVKLEEHDERKWRDLPTAEMGGVAKYLATEEELPHDLTDVRLEITVTPTEPRRAGRAAPEILNYAAILVVSGLVFFGFLQVNDPVRDDRAFEAAKEAGAPGLRGYLIDARNNRHRDEARDALSRLYDPAAAKIASGVKDPVTRDGLLAILNTLREAPQPVVSIDVQEKDTPKENAGGNIARENQLRTDLADAIATHLGKDLIGFVRTPENTPAHFEVDYKFVPHGKDFRGPMYKVTWQLRLRADPAGAALESSEQTTEKAYAISELPVVLPNDLKVAIFGSIFNQSPPVIPPPPPPGDGDFE